MGQRARAIHIDHSRHVLFFESRGSLSVSMVDRSDPSVFMTAESPKVLLQNHAGIHNLIFFEWHL